MNNIVSVLVDTLAPAASKFAKLESYPFLHTNCFLNTWKAMVVFASYHGLTVHEKAGSATKLGLGLNSG